MAFLFCHCLALSHLFFPWCLGKAVLHDCGISWESSHILVLRSRQVMTKFQGDRNRKKEEIDGMNTSRLRDRWNEYK